MHAAYACGCYHSTKCIVQCLRACTCVCACVHAYVRARVWARMLSLLTDIITSFHSSRLTSYDRLTRHYFSPSINIHYSLNTTDNLIRIITYPDEHEALTWNTADSVLLCRAPSPGYYTTPPTHPLVMSSITPGDTPSGSVSGKWDSPRYDKL